MKFSILQSFLWCYIAHWNFHILVLVFPQYNSTPQMNTVRHKWTLIPGFHCGINFTLSASTKTYWFYHSNTLLTAISGLDLLTFQSSALCPKFCAHCSYQSHLVRNWFPFYTLFTAVGGWRAVFCRNQSHPIRLYKAVTHERWSNCFLNLQEVHFLLHLTWVYSWQDDMT